MDDVEIPEEMRAQLREAPKDEAGPDNAKAKMARRLMLKNKIQSVGRMNLMLANMRKN